MESCTLTLYFLRQQAVRGRAAPRPGSAAELATQNSVGPLLGHAGHLGGLSARCYFDDTWIRDALQTAINAQRLLLCSYTFDDAEVTNFLVHQCQTRSKSVDVLVDHQVLKSGHG